MLILDELDLLPYFKNKLTDILPNECTIFYDSPEEGVSIFYNNILICRIYRNAHSYINIYHSILKSDILYGDISNTYTNIKRIIDNKLLYNTLVIDKIIVETITHLNMSIENDTLVDDILGIQLAKLITNVNIFNNMFDDIENKIRTEKLKFVSELN